MWYRKWKKKSKNILMLIDIKKYKKEKKEKVT
jgi:hypothetical protein